jgi:hypothetical protein
MFSMTRVFSTVTGPHFSQYTSFALFAKVSAHPGAELTIVRP